MTRRTVASSLALGTAAVALSALVAVAPAGSGAASAPQSTGTAVAPARPAVASGTVVRQGVGTPVAGVRVVVKNFDATVVLGSDMTGPRGAFSIGGIRTDEISVIVNGRRVGYERGFLGSGRFVVPTYGEASTFTPTAHGRIKLEKD